MATSIHTFIDIFNSTFDNNGVEVKLKRIIIPIIQRDYAQGRSGSDIMRVRLRFLEALKTAILAEPITLDFIYGDIDDDGVMTPLDGQQRLTTLFLLHWYAARKENIPFEKYNFLKCFSYETRYSSRDFCELLIDFTPEFKNKLSEEIIDESWFPLEWKKDATISSMLVMLDSIQSVFSDVSGIWERLEDTAISFYFLPIKDMGLTDELYIKMNSRGKPLSRFEHFKAEFERKLREVDSKIAERIIKKIDIDWMNMLWRYRGDDNTVDDEFLRYFRFICDILCYKNNDTPQGKSTDEFDLLDVYFSTQCEKCDENIVLFEAFFDCWCKIEKTPDVFFDSIFAHKHTIGKTVIDRRYDLNLLNDCLRNYADVMNSGRRSFPLPKIVLLYAVVDYLLNQETVSQEQFLRRIRIINNLIRNSADEISDNVKRDGGNRMPAILRQVDSIMLTGAYMDSNEPNFNVHQLAEEKTKAQWLQDNPSMTENLYKAEDHELLYGHISAIGLEHPEYFERFISLFKCDKQIIAKAMLAKGNYSQRNANYWRYQMGSSWDNSWSNLFHRSGSVGFENTASILREILESQDSFDNDYLMSLVNEYIARCETQGEYDWRYYFLKYNSFFPNRYGMYNWDDFAKPYEVNVLWTERALSQNAYQPFLYEIDVDNLSRDDLGRSIIRDGKRIRAHNNGYTVTDISTGEILKDIIIIKNENGIDTEDRILKARKEIIN